MFTNLKASALVGAATVVANLVVFFLGNVPQSVLTGMGRPISALAVAIASFVPVFLSGSVCYVLSDRLRTYQALVVVLTLASLLLPLQVPGAPGTMLATLMVMHLVAGGAAAFAVPAFSEMMGAED